jgi:phosphatidylinositol alpha-mannosyltransferase
LPADAKIALYLGVIHRKKNLDTLAAAAPAIVAAVPGFRLVIAGNLRDRTRLDARYGRKLARALAPGITSGFVDFRAGYMAPGDIATYLAAADLVLLPHDQSYGSASGIFHHALAAGRATVCSSSPKFGEAREFFGRHIPATIAPARDAGAWVRSVTTLLNDDALRAQAEALARDAARATSWDALAARYVALYQEVAARPALATLAATPPAPGTVPA